MLSVKELAPYLPYELSGSIGNGNNGFIEVEYLSKNSVGCKSSIGVNWFKISSFKPFLRPLSSLTKEIEVNGERFVPWLELRRLYGSDPVSGFDVISYNEWESLYVDFGDHCPGFSLNLMALPLLSKLFEWHFDVFGLIERGLAIEITEG